MMKYVAIALVVLAAAMLAVEAITSDVPVEPVVEFTFQRDVKPPCLPWF